MTSEREARLDERIERAMRLPYLRIIQADEDGYSARVLELPGCFSGGDTAAEAAEELEDAMRMWLEHEFEAERPVPEPLDLHRYSGKLTLRVAPSLHRELAQRALLEEKSLNGLIAELLAIGLRAPLGVAMPVDLNASGSGGGLYRVAESAAEG